MIIALPSGRPPWRSSPVRRDAESKAPISVCASTAPVRSFTSVQPTEDLRSSGWRNDGIDHPPFMLTVLTELAARDIEIFLARRS